MQWLWSQLYSETKPKECNNVIPTHITPECLVERKSQLRSVTITKKAPNDLQQQLTSAIKNLRSIQKIPTYIQPSCEGFELCLVEMRAMLRPVLERSCQ